MNLIHRQNRWWLFSIAKAPVNVKNTFPTEQESAQVLFTAQDKFSKEKKNQFCLYSFSVPQQFVFNWFQQEKPNFMRDSRQVTSKKW